MKNLLNNSFSEIVKKRLKKRKSKHGLDIRDVKSHALTNIINKTFVFSIRFYFKRFFFLKL